MQMRFVPMPPRLGDAPSCTCNNGYQADGDACVDIDECATDNGGCDANATCANATTPGDAPSCTCNNGYQADGDACVDINECATNNGGCDTNATCSNAATPGESPSCTCNAGFSGNGAECSELNVLNCVGAADLDACDYFYGGQTTDGSCFAGVCRGGCSSAGNDCADDTKVCQSFGHIGANDTVYVCIDKTQYTAASDCPTGTHAINREDNTFQCVAPSHVACAGLSDLNDCSYDWGDNSISGTCLDGSCKATCAPANGASAGTMCANSNSRCYASGIIGDANTVGVCIASDTYANANTCPSGTYAVSQNSGYFDCIQPSALL